jgi:hypothetical protein
VLTEVMQLEAVSHPELAVEEDRVVTGLDKAQAEQLLDWLENHGYELWEVSMSANGRLAIRYSCPDSLP